MGGLFGKLFGIEQPKIKDVAAPPPVDRAEMTNKQQTPGGLALTLLTSPTGLQPKNDELKPFLGV